MIDPGPDGPEHLQELLDTVRDAESVRVVLTHGHRDHAPAAFTLADRLGVEVWGPEGLPAVDGTLADGDRLPTDQGDLIAVSTPGHARHHLAFHWPARRALFAGDLLLGHGDTTWVGEYAGCVADYLDSLDRLREIDLAVVYPAHGPPIEDPAGAIERYEAHRLERVRQVRVALADRPELEEDEILGIVYGDGVPQALHGAALRSVRALMEHVGYRGEN